MSCSTPLSGCIQAAGWPRSFDGWAERLNKAQLQQTEQGRRRGHGRCRAGTVLQRGAAGVSPVPGWRHHSVGCSWSWLAPSAPGVKEGKRRGRVLQETGAPPRQEASKPPFSLFILLGIPPPCCPEQTRCHRSLQVNVTTSPSYFLPRVSALWHFW